MGNRTNKGLGILLLMLVGTARILPDTSGVGGLELAWLGSWAVLFVHAVARRLAEHRYAISRRTALALVFLGIALLSGIAATLNGVALVFFLRRLTPIIVFCISIILMEEIRAQETRNMVTAGLAIVATVFVIFGFFSAARADGFDLQSVRVYAGWSWPLIGLVTSVAFWESPGWFGRTASVMSAINTIGLAMTLTRTYWLGAAVAALIYAYCFIRKGRISKPFFVNSVVLVTSAVIILNIALLAVPSLPEMVQQRFAQTQTAVSSGEQSLDERFSEVVGIVQTLNEAGVGVWLTGKGLGATYDFYSLNYYRWGATGIQTQEYAHVYYAYLAFHTGLLGLLTFVWLLAGTFFQGLRAVRQAGVKSLQSTAAGVVGTAVLAVILLAFPPLSLYSGAATWGVIVGLGGVLRPGSDKP